MRKLLLVLLFLTGCEKSIYDFKCSTEEAAIVEKQTVFCKANTELYGSSCFTMAIKQNCSEKK